jgi:hypothetical protein
VPLSGIVRGGPGALLAIETLPVKLLAEAGAKLAVKEVVCPGLRVAGTDKPAMLKPVPEALAAEIVTLAAPELLNVMVCVPLLPTRTFPKLKLDGLGESAASMPLPASEATVGELYALLLIETLPDALPAAVGANCALNVLDCPGARENGKVNPLMPKPAPITLPCEIFKLAVPEFVRVTVWALAVPTATFPKLTLLGEIES